MKDAFKGYYGYEEAEKEAIWQTALIVVDTNVLLDLYRQTPDTRKAILGVLGSDPDRLWIPHQVALEFHRRREEVRKDATKSHQAVEQRLVNDRAHIESAIAEMKKFNVNLNVDAKFNSYAKAVGSLKQAIKNAKTQDFDNAKGEDQLLSEIEALYPESRVGKPFKNKRLSRERQAGAERFRHEVPPGWVDAADKSGDRIYGDYFLWRQTMDYARSVERDVIFVTNETKKDWADASTKRFHPELINEFIAETDQLVLILRPKEFLAEAKRRLRTPVSESEADIANAVRELDEQETRDAAQADERRTQLAARWGDTNFNLADLAGLNRFDGLIAGLTAPMNESISEIIKAQNRQLSEISNAAVWAALLAAQTNSTRELGNDDNPEGESASEVEDDDDSEQGRTTE